MSKTTDQDYKTANAMIEYYVIYNKFGQRESEKGAAKRIAAKNKLNQLEE